MDKNKKISSLPAMLVFGGFIVVFLIAILVSLGGNNTVPEVTPAVSQQDKDAAQKELVEFMNLAKGAGMVTSYEFSETGNTVYVGNIWYTQTVQFKKDFLGKIALLKQKITGYHHFEVHDAYSNDKVAEVTAFGGSLEVYK